MFLVALLADLPLPKQRSSVGLHHTLMLGGLAGAATMSGMGQLRSGVWDSAERCVFAVTKIC